jgi:long-chain acyl-CoA synthetase
MLTNDNFVSNTQAAIAAVPVREDDVRLCMLPLSHSFARTVDYYGWFLSGSQLALMAPRASMQDTLRDIRPTVLSCVPHFCENAQRYIQENGLEHVEGVLRGFLGGRIRWCISGGAPLPVHVARFFWDRHVPLLEGYGLTESSPVISINREHAPKLGTVGPAIPGVEIRIAEDGEVLSRGRHIMRGYWNKPEATEAALEDGWLHTGDLGSLDEEGYLTITGRKKELIVTAGGKNIAPRYVEGLLAEDPYILQVVVCGDRRHYLTALIVPNFATLLPALRERGIPTSSPEDVVRRQDVYELMQERVQGRLADVADYERVKDFVLLSEPFSAERSEMTPTMKTRREVILRCHAAEIESLYARGRTERRA